MSTDDRYNGWTNRETWNTALWINNDEYLSEEAHRIVAEHIDDPDPYASSEPDPAERDAMLRRYRVSRAADDLAEWYAETLDSETTGVPALPGPIADAWTYALGCTDWREIADTYYDDALESAAEDRAALDEQEPEA